MHIPTLAHNGVLLLDVDLVRSAPTYRHGLSARQRFGPCVNVSAHERR
jgi:hypothetical protein